MLAGDIDHIKCVYYFSERYGPKISCLDFWIFSVGIFDKAENIYGIGPELRESQMGNILLAVDLFHTVTA